MVKYSEAALDSTFGALADPVRRAVLARLAQGVSSVSKLAAPFSISLPGFAKHIRVLERAGLVSSEKDGRIRRCRLDPQAMSEAAEWISHYREFWEAQFDALSEHLAESNAHNSRKIQFKRAPKKEKKVWPHQVLHPKPLSKSSERSRRRSPRSSTPGRNQSG
ncbi:MAG: helix-turn-helix transcriptional regulator [Acidipila sp.]|nr:helix-turn-helix transcriptional regulator [Acidipila sp.]